MSENDPKTAEPISLDELDSALRDENFFFSENLLMDREDVKQLSALSDEEKEEFTSRRCVRKSTSTARCFRL
jgi:hypothetical protein